MSVMRNRLDLPDTGIPMAVLFVMAVLLAVLANVLSAAWIAGL
jgi:hypothetical protein